MTKIIGLIKKEVFLSILLLLTVILAVFYPYKIKNYPLFVDWQTITALTGLLIITAGIKESGFFDYISRNMLKKLKNEKSLATFLIFISIFLSAFLTNDITLFIVIPLTLGMQNLIKNDISKLIIFEAISVNVGSALTPIGNPQNLFLWHKWDISFVMFIYKMIPLVAILIVILLVFTWLVFPARKIKFSKKFKNAERPNKILFVSSLTILIIYLISLEIKIAYIALPILFILYLLFYRNVLFKTDWILLLTFIIIFIDFRIVSTIPIIIKYIQMLNLQHSGNVFLFSALTSQLISNVPASVFVSKFSSNWLAITYGVNVAGNGLAIGSLANIIALRMVKTKKIWIDFHKYSVFYFLVTGIIIYILFFIL